MLTRLQARFRHDKTMMGNKKFILVALLLLIVASASGWLATKYLHLPARQLKQPLIELNGDTAENAGVGATVADDTITAKIFLPSDDEAGIKIEERSIKNSPVPVKMAEAVVMEYLKGLKQGLKDTKLLGIYRDKRSIIYIDLSDEFRKMFSGDVRQEYALLKSLYETVTVNVPGTEDVRVLVDGKEVESVGGHFDALYPLGNTVKEESRQPAADNSKKS
ncbi:MAG: GerMN domain-containing protein [Nitrospirae bacterium]|nr:GerMN domain-containing protein [Nitrospirota bacterium]